MTQIDADVPLEPLTLQADATNLEMETYERPLTVTPFGTPEIVPDWHDSHAMRAYVPPSCLGRWVRTDLECAPFRVLAKIAPLGSRWCVALLAMYTLGEFLNLYLVKFIFRCRCTIKAFQAVGLLLVILVTLRLLLSIVSCLHCCFTVLPIEPCLLPLFLRGGGGVPRPFRPLCFRSHLSFQTLAPLCAATLELKP